MEGDVITMQDIYMFDYTIRHSCRRAVDKLANTDNTLPATLFACMDAVHDVTTTCHRGTHPRR